MMCHQSPFDHVSSSTEPKKFDFLVKRFFVFFHLTFFWITKKTKCNCMIRLCMIAYSFINVEIAEVSLFMSSSSCMQFPNCCAVRIHPHVYVPQGVYVCCHCAVCVSRAPTSCCNACINTLLGLSKLSVNWGGKSLCAALFSHVTYPVSAVENKSANFRDCSHSQITKDTH